MSFKNLKLNYSKSIEIEPLHQDMAETDKIIELGREQGFLGRFLMRFTPCEFSNVTHNQLNIAKY